MLHALATKKQQSRRHKKSFGDDGYVYNLDYGDFTIDVCICPNTDQNVYIKHAVLGILSKINKAGKR